MSSGLARIGSVAPDFSTTALIDGSKIEDNFTLSQFLGKYVVLFFYPMDFTWICPTEITAFSEHVTEFSEINCQVLAVNTDSIYTHLEWVKASKKDRGLGGSTKIPLLADKNHEIVKKYGVLAEDLGIPYRAVFVIDDKGILRHFSISDFPVGRSLDELLRVVKAFQFSDEHDEVCPVNWKKGNKTIKVGVEESKKYFDEL